jgi:hypothetical protein
MSRVVAAPHVHSTWSYDGRWELPDLAREFRRRGYDAVLTAEHDRGWNEARWAKYRSACAEASAAGALVVPGIEYADPDDTVHVAVWGELPFLGDGQEIEPLVERASGLGAVCVLAHPERRAAWRRLTPGFLESLAGVELWNRKYDGWAPGGTGRLLADRDGLTAFVGLDFHTERQFFPLALALAVEDEPTVERVYAALREARFEATAFGVPVSRWVSQPTLALARSAERIRGPVARRIRRVLA